MSNTFEEMEFRQGFAGGCYVNGTETCVAQPEDYCDEGTFVSAHYVRSNSGHPLRYCAGDLEDVAIGRCGDSGKCSNLQSRCEDESSFVAFDPTCTTTQDLSSSSSSSNDNNGMMFVTYGKCGDRCVWSSEDCLEGEAYILNDPECTAEKVQIGACFAGHAFCAVGQKSCTQPNLPDEPFWTHQEVLQKIGANCFLSSLPRPPSISPVAAPSSNVDINPNNNNNNNNVAATLDENGILNSNSNSGLALVAIVAVVAIVVGILIGVSTVYCKRKDEEKEAWRIDKQPTLPVEDLETSHQIEIADSENLSDI